MREGIRRIFFDIATGDKIHEIGRNGSFILPTIDQDIATFTSLSERNRETFDVLELPFGAYMQDFAECTGYRVNVETRELEFSYPDPNVPQEPPVYQKALSTRVDDLEEETINTMLAVTESYETQIINDSQREQENVDTMMGLAESYELIMQLQARIDELESRLA